MDVQDEELEINDGHTWFKRHKFNCFIFILSYAFMGCVTGITNDSFISYLDLTTDGLIEALPTFSSFGTIIMAIIVMFIHRTGYKKIVIGSAVVGIISLLLSSTSTNSNLIIFAYVLSVVGIGMFDYMYPLMFTSYSPKEKRVKLFSLVMCVNLITQAIVGFFNGKWVVGIFSNLQGISYEKASLLTKNAAQMKGSMLDNYIHAYQVVIWIAVGLTVLALICALFLKEKKADYQESEEELAKRKAEKAIDLSKFKSKTIILWIIYNSLVRIGAMMVVGFFPIYLNKFLHIERGVVSTIITAQTFAMVFGYLFAPWLEKKLGAIVAKAVTTLACIPLMLLLANGTMFGKHVAIAVGIILFLRSGVANAGVPIQQSLQMTFVSKNLQPAFSSLMMIVNAVVGILGGMFTGWFLNVVPNGGGYGLAYYITCAFYLVANIMLLVCFTKKFNRALQSDEDVVIYD